MKKKPINVKIGDGKTKYSVDFPEMSDADLANARQPANPDRGGRLYMALGGRGPNLVKVSHIQNTHNANFNQTFDAVGEVDPEQNVYMSKIRLQGYHGGDFSKTSYHHEFNGRNQKRSLAVGSLMRTMDKSSSA